MLDNESLRILFVCSMNQWRSPTAERVYSDKPLIQVRSGGTDKSARQRVNSGDLKWANLVLVMEQKHKQRLMAAYPDEMRAMEIHVLDIPDSYNYMDAELIDEITAAVDPIIAGKEKLR